MLKEYIRKPTVLLTDPDPSYLEIMRDLLSQRFEVLTASNVKEALDICWDKDVDLIISEMNLPDDSAESLFEKLKRKMPNTLSVVITKDATVENAILALRLGAIDFIKKPFSVEDIALLIEKYYSLAVNKTSEYDLLETLVEEKRLFELPTDFRIVNPFLNELLDMIRRLVKLDKKVLLAIRLSIYEMIVNAMEHGNLEIDYEQKKLLLEKIPDYQKYLHEKARTDAFRNKKVFLSYHLTDDQLIFKIKDEGKGFNASDIPSPVNQNTVSELNGRGIFITKVNMDEMLYNDSGTEVTLIKYLNENIS